MRAKKSKTTRRQKPATAARVWTPDELRTREEMRSLLRASRNQKRIVRFTRELRHATVNATIQLRSLARDILALQMAERCGESDHASDVRLELGERAPAV